MAARFASFNPSDINEVAAVVRRANLTETDVLVIEEFLETSVETIWSTVDIWKKIDASKLSEILQKIDLLNTHLTEFITSPGIIMEFLGDPKKSEVVIELQKLLPR